MSLFSPKTLLVATDLTPASEAAVAFAADLADSLDAKVILFHALSPLGFVDYGVFDDDLMERTVEGQSKAIEAKLRRMIAEFFPQHVTVRPRIVSGYPISSICQAAREESADLILMGSHGRNVVMSFLVGSVTQGVLFSTSRPLIIVPKKRSPMERKEILTILCPVNFTDTALRSLSHAAQLGARLGAEVLALHLIEPEEMADAREVTTRLEKWVPEAIREVCHVRILVHRGNPAEEVIRYARAQEVDLIVIGAEHKRFADFTVLGTTTERVTRHAPCPVMAVLDQRQMPAHTEKVEEEEPVSV